MVPDIKHPIPKDEDFKAWMLSMPLITVDFETYYDDQFSLKKMTMVEYVQDERFKAQGMSIRVDWIENGQLQRGDTVYHRDCNTGMEFLKDFDRWVLVAQNTKFEGYIMHYHWGVHPTVYADTKSMSKGKWPHASSSLANLAERLWPNRPDMRKGNELIGSKGVVDWTEEMHLTIGEGYCNQDTFLTAEALWELFNEYPTEELEVIHITCRMFCHPTMTADHTILKKALVDEREKREEALGEALEMIDKRVKAKGLDYWNPDAKEAKKQLPLDKKILTSRNRFIALLEDLFDLEVPMKTVDPGKPTERRTKATGKNDPEFIKLMDDNLELHPIFNARMIWSSSIASSRARRMIDFSKEEKGFEIPVPLGYYNAHTGRFSGEEKVNMQNLQRNSPHRLALYAPKGFNTHVIDSSNIEARVLAVLAEQDELIDIFKNGGDVYADFATDFYGFEVKKSDNPFERSVGKVCVGGDTHVITNNGVKQITDLTTTDKLWDGTEWVSHEGVVCNGEKKTITAFGLEATPDHEILVGNSWVEWQQVLTNHSLLNTALSSASLPCSDGRIKSKTESHKDGTQSYSAHAAQHKWLTEQTSSKGDQPVVTNVQNEPQAKNDTGNTKTHSRTMNTEHACLTDSHQQSPDATTKTTECTNIMDCEASTSLNNGEKIEQASSDTSRQSEGGINQNLKWTEKMSTRAMNPETSDLSQEKKTSGTNEKLRTLNNKYENLKNNSLVYDVVNAGPRKRFTVLTNTGPLVVHNCVLGLGYGMGAKTLRHTFASGPMGMEPLLIPMEQSEGLVRTYRSKNYMIKQYWDTAGKMISYMATLQPGEAIEWGPLHVIHEGIVLPNGMKLHYPQLRYHEPYNSMAYWDGKMWKRIYGGILVENIVQALARIVVVSQMVQIDRLWQQHGGWITMQVHDENIGVLPKFGEEKDAEIYAESENIMRQSPSWLPNLPLDAEGGWAENYSK